MPPEVIQSDAIGPSMTAVAVAPPPEIVTTGGVAYPLPPEITPTATSWPSIVQVAVPPL